MKDLIKYLDNFLFATSGMLMLCICFSMNTELANGVIIGEITWFNFTLILFASSVIFSELTTKSEFHFKFIDLILILLFVLSYFCYDQKIDAKPEKLNFTLSLILLWFMLRPVLAKYTELRIFYMIIIILTAILGCIIGFTIHNNPDYLKFSAISLYNSIMYDDASIAYLVIVFPICFSFLLVYRKCKKSDLFNIRTSLFYLSALGCLLITISLLIAGKPNIIFTIIISCLWILWIKNIGLGKTSAFVSQHHRLFRLGSIALFGVIAIVAFFITLKKSEVGDPQLLIWNVTTKAITEQPLKGTGYGLYPKIYAETQAAYFSSGKASEIEKINAISPISANNEYLQIGVEYGLMGLLLFILLIAMLLYYGIKNRHYACSGSILSMAIFAMYSNYLQYPSLWIIGVFLGAICVTKPSAEKKKASSSSRYVGIIAAIGTIILVVTQKDLYKNYKQWAIMQRIYESGNYDLAIRKYAEFFKYLKHQPDFVYEGVDCYSKTNNPETAAIWLKEILQISAEPRFYYAMAENKIKMGHYQDAERFLIEIAQILPRKGETYIRFMRLYSLPENLQLNKLQETVSMFEKISTNETNDVSPEMWQEAQEIMALCGLAYKDEKSL